MPWWVFVTLALLAGWLLLLGLLLWLGRRTRIYRDRFPDRGEEK